MLVKCNLCGLLLRRQEGHNCLNFGKKVAEDTNIIIEEKKFEDLEAVCARLHHMIN
jgi:hypothetical protein